MKVLLLAEDSTTDILCRLSIKDILRARSVCKLWKSIIDSYHFKNYHYAVQCVIEEDDAGPPLLLNLRRRFENTWNEVYDYCPMFLESNFYLLSTLNQFQDLASNLYRDIRKTNSCLYIENLCIKGIARGVVCLLEPDVEKCRIDTRKSVALWNPALRELKTIPLPLPTGCVLLDTDHDLGPPQEYTVQVLGFGFDPTSNQFKILCSTTSFHWCRRQSNVSSEYMITAGITSYDLYSQKTDSWKTLHYVDHDEPDPSLSSFILADGTAIRPFRLDTGVLANHRDHVVYCMAKLFQPENKIKSDFVSHTTLTLPPQIILAFDFVSEKFHKVSDLPPDTSKRSCRSLIPYKGSLAVTVDDHERESCEIWVMKKLVGTEVWKKVIVIEPLPSPLNRPCRSDYIPLSVLENGKVLLLISNYNYNELMDHDLYLYDPTLERYQELSIVNFVSTFTSENWCGIFPYVQSLLSV